MSKIHARRAQSPSIVLNVPLDLGSRVPVCMFSCSWISPVHITSIAIQNSYSELWNIINWTHPGCVGSKKQWEGYVDRPLTKGQSKSASAEERLQAVVCALVYSSGFSVVYVLLFSQLVARILKDKVLPDNFLRRCCCLSSLCCSFFYIYLHT